MPPPVAPDRSPAATSVVLPEVASAVLGSVAVVDGVVEDVGGGVVEAALDADVGTPLVVEPDEPDDEPFGEDGFDADAAVDDGRVPVDAGRDVVEPPLLRGRLEVLVRGVVELEVGRVLICVGFGCGEIGAMPGAVPDPNRQPMLLPLGAGSEEAPTCE